MTAPRFLPFSLLTFRSQNTLRCDMRLWPGKSKRNSLSSSESLEAHRSVDGYRRQSQQDVSLQVIDPAKLAEKLHALFVDEPYDVQVRSHSCRSQPASPFSLTFSANRSGTPSTASSPRDLSCR